jgi:simple sugar transport system permease protein
MAWPASPLNLSLLLALAAALGVYLLLWRHRAGYRIRAVGFNERASRYAGINVRRQVVLAMCLAGGCAGLAGVVQVLGLQYRLQTDGSPAGFTANAGFNGIVAALFGGLNPFGAIPASIFFGGLLVGAQNMQRDIGVPASLITAVNGIIVIFAVSSQVFVQRRRQRRRNVEAHAPATALAPDTVEPAEASARKVGA